MVKRSAIFLVVLMLLVSACAKAAPKEQAVYTGAAVPPAQPQEGSRESLPALDISANTSTAADDNRIVIRNANLSIVVANPAQVMDAVMKMADEMNGFVVDSNLYQAGERNGVQLQQATVTIRVPAERLEEARTRIKSYVENVKTDILSDNVSGQDITKEYTDLQSQLRSYEDAADQLTKLMDSATKVDDVLNIFNQLRQINQQIEVLKGQIKYYDEAAAMSAITVQIQAKESVQPVSVAGWSPKGVFRDALQALVDAYQFLASAVIWIVITILPVALPIAVVIYLIVKGIQRLRRKPRVPKTKGEAVE